MTQKFTRSLPLPASVLFPLATLAPLVLLLLGVSVGGLWPLIAVAYLAGLTFALDRYMPLVAPDASILPEAVPQPTAAAVSDQGEGPDLVIISGAPKIAPDKIGPDWLMALPASEKLLMAIGATQLLMMPVMLYAIAGTSEVGFLNRIILFLGFGMYLGQVCIPAAHELIHRGDKPMFQMGLAMFTTLLFGHHTSAHRMVHHRHVGSVDDPNTARDGETFYVFFPRAWVGSFKAGLEAENKLRAANTGIKGIHPYAVYLGGAAFMLLLAAAIGGYTGIVVMLALALYAQAQLLLTDYVQHYGLMRAKAADGSLEPVAFKHSWNAPHWYSSAVMLNAPRHSDHHAHPSRPYPQLQLPDESQDTWLPYSLPVSCAFALSPRHWKALMAAPLAKLRNPAAEPATPA
ncbi:alkane 1-monooxygenase [Rhodobacter ferrooxidans]|uniref:Fatty acid desaturase n=1 Tax=Rhodobacter ferrooxidans TaxID=371731 RepID=C8S4L9_9RHOB|nr:alkane 1-monooxygenase [Rhodobacter sp. SW2]EEW24102.1 fatty acid desaturase [Rhodobacter sp. SW2]